MTFDDPLPRLADSLAAISTQLRSISDELRTFETSSRLAPAPPAEPAVAHTPNPMPYPPPPYQPYPVVPGHRNPPQPPLFDGPLAAGPLEPSPTLWERMSREGAGSRLIAWGGGVVTLVGVLLLLMLAVQRGYLGPAPRVLLGAVLAAALIGIALRVRRIPGPATGAQALAATGLAVGYVDTIAASGYYHFVPAPAGLLIALAIAALGVAIAVRWDSQLLATFVSLACAASAVVLTREITVLVGFLLVLQIAAGPAVLLNRWPVLAVGAASPPVLAVLLDIMTTSLGGARDAVTVAALCLATTVVQSAVATVLAFTDRKRTDVAIGLLVAAPVPSLIAALLVTRYQAVALTGGLALLLAGLSVLARYRRLAGTVCDAAAATALAAAFEATCIGFTGDARPLAVLLAATLLAGLSAQLRQVATLVAAALFGAAGLAFALAGPLRVDYVALAPRHRVPPGAIVTAAATGLLLAVAALAVCWASGRVASSEDRTSDDARHTRWLLSAIVALYGATGAILSIGLAISPDERGFLVGHMLVTLSWTVGALVLLLRHLDSVPLRVTGLTLVGAALAKLLLFDLASLSGLPRVLAFLGGGLVLLAAGARYAKLVTSRRT
jgi:uncharacterized membrane protein